MVIIWIQTWKRIPSVSISPTTINLLLCYIKLHTISVRHLIIITPPICHGLFLHLQVVAKDLFAFEVVNDAVLDGKVEVKLKFVTFLEVGE